ncbi:hypothetical protein [Psychrobacillus sp. FSL K6-1267]|uniref:hypothetical protein n=1 Tax=Psychrobacillus sp. FSL K6-1267 TaxID=2921543 RepID=UPI0030FBF1B5
MNGYVWEVTMINGEKIRVASEGKMIDEALQNFRHIHGYQNEIFKIKYLMKLGEVHA